MLLAWLLFVAPAAGVLVRGPGARTLRALPIPMAAFGVAHGVARGAVHAPWIALWALGASPTTAMAWIFGAISLATCVTARGTQPSTWGLASNACASAVLRATTTDASLLGALRVAVFLALVLIGFVSFGAAVLLLAVVLAGIAETTLALRATGAAVSS